MQYLERFIKLVYGNKTLALSARFVTLTVVVLVFFLVTVGMQTEWVSKSDVSIYLIAIWFLLLVAGTFYAFLRFPGEKAIESRLRSFISAIDWDAANKLIAKTKARAIISPKFSVQLRLIESLINRFTGKTQEAYELLLNLKSDSLIPSELINVELDRAFLLFENGNIKAANKIADWIRKKKLDFEGQLRLVILDSRLAEVSGDISRARDLIEHELESQSLKGHSKIGFLHQLALLESLTGKKQFSLDYYQEAWSLQLKDKVDFSQARSTAENLIFLLMQLGKKAEAQGVLKDFTHLVDNKNTQQLIELHNLKVDYARELNNRELLEAEYRFAEDVIVPLLHEDERLPFFVSGLRMRWNDQIDFELALLRTMQLMITARNIVVLDKLRAFKSITAILQQALEHYVNRPDLLAYHGWFVMEWVRLQDDINVVHKSLPVALPGLRQEWYSLQIHSIKLRLNLFVFGIPKSEFARLFSFLNELGHVWKDKGNPYAQMQTLMIVVDEYLSYSRQISDEEFRSDHKKGAIDALNEAQKIMVTHKDNPNFYQFMVGLAYFYSEFGISKSESKYWLDLFDSKGVPLTHFAIWFRKQYEVAKNWVNNL